MGEYKHNLSVTSLFPRLRKQTNCPRPEPVLVLLISWSAGKEIDGGRIIQSDSFLLIAMWSVGCRVNTAHSSTDTSVRLRPHSDTYATVRPWKQPIGALTSETLIYLKTATWHTVDSNRETAESDLKSIFGAEHGTPRRFLCVCDLFHKWLEFLYDMWPFSNWQVMRSALVDFFFLCISCWLLHQRLNLNCKTIHRG